jgi:hypothetical protein
MKYYVSVDKKYSLKSMQIEGTILPEWFLRVERQPEVGIEVYDKGSRIFKQFFTK